jgi:hypothetical protein
LKNLTSLSLFNADRHRDVRIIPGPDMTWSRRLNHAQIGLSETGVAASDYPLLFMKDSESGRFRLIALFGLRPDANFFVVGDQWQATYLPLQAMGAPFHLAGPEKALCIDEASDLVSTDSGIALFSEDSDETAELSRIQSMFDYLRSDLDVADDFVTALMALGLIRPLSITLEFGDGASEQVEGLYSISPPRLGALDDAAIIDLHRRTYLDKIHIIINSLGQLNRIQQLSQFHIDRKITRLLPEMDA